MRNVATPTTLFVAALLLTGWAHAVKISDINLSPNSNPSAPLAGILTFKTDAPTVATITVSDGTREITGTPTQSPATDHKLPVLGLRPGRENTVTFSVKDNGGNTAKATAGVLTTDPLPDGFPPVELRMARPRKMEPGFTFVPLFRWPGVEPQDDYGLVYALDARGEVVWYLHTDYAFGEVFKNKAGNLVFQVGRNGVMKELDMLGNLVRSWHSTGLPKDDLPAGSIPVETDTFHHTMELLPNGNFLMLSTEVRHFDDYYTTESDPEAERAPSGVIGDVLVEFKPDGTILREWKLFDILDPYRIGYGSLGTFFYAEVYQDVLEKPAKDWSHFNSVFYDAEEDAAILSSYHLDLVMKLSLKTGDIVWMLGNHSGWREPWKAKLLHPVKEPFRWQYHQHAAKITPDGNIIMYDNGTHGAPAFHDRAPREELYSRAVEFKIDEKDMSVEEVWSYGGPDDELFMSPFICDVDWMPETGNVLVTDGGRVRTRDGGDSTSVVGGKHWARIFEVTHESPADKVFEIVIDDPETGWAVFRADRFPSLYP